MPERSRTERTPTDRNELAAFIVQESTGDEEVADDSPKSKNPAAVALGRLGGKKGGLARAKKLGPARRREIAQQAARARWGSRR